MGDSVIKADFYLFKECFTELLCKNNEIPELSWERNFELEKRLDKQNNNEKNNHQNVKEEILLNYNKQSSAIS
ncbi:hypothetical protein CLV48_101700 [Cecembia rubra]|uniref:Uncharacterized protein n=2 Tax=Cecembia rubra TaxID=1485585 RepID=A0A2P8EE56_9BACT|nr:hypothetical protein CLV48_101700 [Cecembia rubra]